jgi:hypothetical protein
MRNSEEYRDELRTACEKCMESYAQIIEAISKERDDWRERYEELVEVTATRTDQAANRSC